MIIIVISYVTIIFNISTTRTIFIIIIIHHHHLPSLQTITKELDGFEVIVVGNAVIAYHCAPFLQPMGRVLVLVLALRKNI